MGRRTDDVDVPHNLEDEGRRRRYDATLSPETNMGRIRLAGDIISPEEWEDPATKVKPENLRPMPLPERPKSINLLTQSKTKLTDDVEAINIVVEEQEMMKYVSSADTSPATLVSLLLNRAIARLHPDSSEGVPMMVLAINERPAVGCPKAAQSMASSLMLSYTDEMRGMDIDMQQTIYRGMVILQSSKDNVIERFLKSRLHKTCSKEYPLLRPVIRQWSKHTVWCHRLPQHASAMSARLIWAPPKNTSARCTQKSLRRTRSPLR